MRRTILLAGPALLLAACGGGSETDNVINADQTLSVETFSSNDVTAIDAVTGEASNMAADVDFLEGLDNGGGNATAAAPAKAGESRREPRRPPPATADAEPAPEPAPQPSAAPTANNAI